MSARRVIGIVVVCWGLLWCMSCETPVSLEIPGYVSPLIIEGWIENGRPATVAVSRAMSYYSEVTLSNLLASIDTNAVVEITDEDGRTERLMLRFSADHMFGLLGRVYVGELIRGQAGHSYSLRVKSGDSIYTATTYIPETTVQIDSLYLNIQNPEDTAALIRMRIQDDANAYNCYRFFTKIKGLDMTFNQVSMGTFDDLTFNGMNLFFELTRMPSSNMMVANMTPEEYENYYRVSFRKGDVIYVKSTQTDVATCRYWTSLQAVIAGGQNPFITPGTHPTNIKGNNVSGIWSGYCVRYDTVEFK
ncbi:MAG: DUF4249 domain-containing protein [Bacteroidales bacterium]|jgi:hypothetical protein|nr:DUF4249 domain-containing protein [Bacteroidales bacterium]